MSAGAQKPPFLWGGDAQNSVFSPQPSLGRQEGKPILQKVSPKLNPPRLRKCRAGNSPRVDSASRGTPSGLWPWPGPLLLLPEPPCPDRCSSPPGSDSPPSPGGRPGLDGGAGPALGRRGPRAGSCCTTPLLRACTRGWAPAEPHQLKVPNKGKGDRANGGVRGGGRAPTTF